ncbi:putative DNA-binding protein [Actinacidiphila reveromycinica]|uniref:Putative DNA-binding protein n=1 Tax=Actinacidiphila reveromycinica TaxID=659352 RepID=A0A7U3UZW9_9ACTN|nr:helix-turn-helix transcriptional regulator [Streptomyces sp. SN-593]BBB01906.1 putative DNA-binding protein [Streptomyces sp. SN-593]
MATAVTRTGDDVSVGALLRGWRTRRHLTQLALALEADTSARHISFIETGRSAPSRAMVLRLAERLDVPVPERNALLVAAGFAPYYPRTPLDDAAVEPLRTGLDVLLTAYEPYPALVMDGMYDIVAANSGLWALLDGVDDRLLRPPVNGMLLTLHPRGLAPRIRNLPEWRAHLLERVRRQAALRSAGALRGLYEEMAAYPPPDGRDRTPADQAAGPHDTVPYPLALPLRIEKDGRLLSFVSTVATFNTPMDVTVSELAVEAFLPADADTAAFLRSADRTGPSGSRQPVEEAAD